MNITVESFTYDSAASAAYGEWENWVDWHERYGRIWDLHTSALIYFAGKVTNCSEHLALADAMVEEYDRRAERAYDMRYSEPVHRGAQPC